MTRSIIASLIASILFLSCATEVCITCLVYKEIVKDQSWEYSVRCVYVLYPGDVIYGGGYRFRAQLNELRWGWKILKDSLQILLKSRRMSSKNLHKGWDCREIYFGGDVTIIVLRISMMFSKLTLSFFPTQIVSESEMLRVRHVVCPLLGTAEVFCIWL